jgi:hypothetical protein
MCVCFYVCLTAASVVNGGRVDLFACDLLGHPEGKEVFDMIETLTKVNFAASTDKTGMHMKLC